MKIENQIHLDGMMPYSENAETHEKRFFIDLFKLQDVVFCWCIKPQYAIGLPTSIIFSDASSQAYGAFAYAQWELEDAQYEAENSCLSLLSRE